MTYNYPLWGFPSFRRNYYYQRPNYYKPNNYRSNSNADKSSNILNNSNNISNNYSTNFNKNISNESAFNLKQEATFSQNENRKIDFSCNDNYYSDSEYFNIFGLSLHIDDLLILALIFFLYKEGTDDIYLYIALFLLLLS